ncbi:MAG: 50S ribosomal protein L23 [bacterium]|nr:50S ribosomal protein L23 [bacterium]
MKYEIDRVIIKPIITEKATELLKSNKYVFKVNIKSNKIEIKKAIEEYFKVKVAKVTTLIQHGKVKRVRYKSGITSDWKKAIVTLKEGEVINLGA